MEEREQVLQLYLKEHLGYKVIAKKVDLPLETVKSWIRRYRKANGLTLGNHPGSLPKKTVQEKTEKDYEKRIKQLEMEVELLRDFLSEQERRSIKK
jgi:transposase